MADIVERLRGPAPLHWEAKEAADEITRLRAEVEDLGNRLHHVHRLWANNEHALRAEVEKLKAALEGFVCNCEREQICIGSCLHKNARAALEGKHD